MYGRGPAEGRAGAGWPDGGEPRVVERVAHTTQKQWRHSAEHFLSCAPPKAQRSEVKGYATLGGQLSGRNLFIECYLELSECGLRASGRSAGQRSKVTRHWEAS